VVSIGITEGRDLVGLGVLGVELVAVRALLDGLWRRNHADTELELWILLCNEVEYFCRCLCWWWSVSVRTMNFLKFLYVQKCSHFETVVITTHNISFPS